MKDRLVWGFLAGVIARIPALIFGLTAVSLQWTTLRWAHFAAILVYGHNIRNLSENIFATLITFFFCGFLGANFIRLIPRISCGNYLFKGWFFGASFWLFAFVTMTLFKVPGFVSVPLNSIISNFIEASIWGLSLGYCLRRFDNRFKVYNPKESG